MAGNLVIILTTGPEDLGNRATLAFSMGVSALISGAKTSIYMTMGGTVWSRSASLGNVHVAGFEPLREYVEQFIEAGGQIMVCSPCNEFYCAMGRGGDLLEGAEICGLATVVDLALDASVVTL